MVTPGKGGIRLVFVADNFLGLYPYATKELDAHKKMLDERFPHYEHWYIRCGSIVTWCDRRKPG